MGKKFLLNNIQKTLTLKESVSKALFKLAPVRVILITGAFFVEITLEHHLFIPQLLMWPIVQAYAMKPQYIG